eukprot:CAMPEP_0170493660 /NCGR_PEP_ID=MMETSP0208-20121228/14198_1 /TAXON_ID=197538 /ORGANISM="Strombidium inclinatum, Strain S3" /LENGTH=305 /DNA_ID=CAMNT_0010769611 /DNA_START=311 /DNA_END=1226 /DNA_ORIENTATION=+
MDTASKAVLRSISSYEVNISSKGMYELGNGSGLASFSPWLSRGGESGRQALALGWEAERRGPGSRASWSFVGLFVLNFGVDSGFGLVVHPLADEQLIFIAVEERALAFSHVVDPVAFEVVATPLGEYAVAVPLAFVPLAFVDVAVAVNHAAFSLRHAVDPVAVVTVAVFEKEGASAMLLVLEPVAGVLPPEFVVFVSPVCSLAVFLVHGPHAFVLVAVFVELDTEAFFAVVSPVADEAARFRPHISPDAAVFLSGLLLDPVEAAMGSVLLRLGIGYFPEVDEGRLLVVRAGLLVVLLAVDALIFG